MAAVIKRILVALLVVGIAGCNLTLDVANYPYQGAGARDAGPLDARADVADTAELDAAADTADATEATDASDDATSGGKPYLIFTELMPDTSAPPGESVEYGEYVEVKNVGTAPADPRRIIIRLAGSNRRIQVNPFPITEEGQRALAALRPIAPGHYFVFVRQDSDYYKLTANLKQGAFYEYGRWSDAVPLSNASRRLVLAYRDSEFHIVIHDTVEWSAHSLIDPEGQSDATLPVREDVAWGLEADFEDDYANNDPAHWCYHVDALPGSPIKASPGAPTPSDCTRP